MKTTLMSLHLKKISEDSLLSESLTRVGFIIKPPWLKTEFFFLLKFRQGHDEY